MKEKINLPNKLTILRMLLVPVFVVLMLLADMLEMRMLYYISCAVFVIASLTDFLDGYLSRKNNEVTKFGKIMDPLADKLLVASRIYNVNRSFKDTCNIHSYSYIKRFYNKCCKDVWK